MTHVDFYIIKNGATREALACQLVEKAYQQNQKVYVHVESPVLAHAFDEQLWTFKDNSFIPHNLSDETLFPPPPVRIGSDTPKDRADVLINLSNTLPDFFAKFTRVIEIVDEHNKEQKRDQYKLYREKQCTLQSYQL